WLPDICSVAFSLIYQLQLPIPSPSLAAACARRGGCRTCSLAQPQHGLIDTASNLLSVRNLTMSRLRSVLQSQRRTCRSLATPHLLAPSLSALWVHSLCTFPTNETPVRLRPMIKPSKAPCANEYVGTNEPSTTEHTPSAAITYSLAFICPPPLQEARRMQ